MPKTPAPWFYRQTGWWMCWIDGRKVKLAKGKKNKREAEQCLLKLRWQAASNPDTDSPQQTVASVIESYQAFAHSRLAKSTLEIRAFYLQSFAEAQGWRLISACKPHHMESWLDAHPDWASDWTKVSAIRNVQVAFRWASRSQIISRNPFDGVNHHVGLPRRDVTVEEFQALLRATPSKGRKKLTPGARFRQVLVFLWFTGCRPQEAYLLEWKHVDFDDAVIILPHHKTLRTQRRPRPRIIHLDPIVINLLRSIKRRGEGSRVFLTHKLTPWNRGSLGKRMRRARQRAGIPDDAKLYGLRHAFGTRGTLNGCDIKTLSTLMGHTTTRMCEHYVHLAGQREHLAAAMRLVNGRRRET